MLVVCGALGIIDCLILCGADGLAVALTLLLCNCLILGCALLVQGIPKLEISWGFYPMGGHPKAPCGKLVNDFLIFLSWHKCNPISLYEIGFFSAPIQYMYIHICRKLCMKILSCNTVKRYRISQKEPPIFFLKLTITNTVYDSPDSSTPRSAQGTENCLKMSHCVFFIFLFLDLRVCFSFYNYFFFFENYCVTQLLL